MKRVHSSPSAGLPRDRVEQAAEAVAPPGALATDAAPEVNRRVMSRAIMFQTLARLQREAEELGSRPNGFRGEDLAGFVESVAVDELGRCWIIGWLRNDVPEQTSVQIVDRQRFSAAAAFIRFSRTDVPDGATGVIGLVVGEWRPTALTEEVFLVLGAVAPRYMRGLMPLSVVPVAQVASALEQARLDDDGGYFAPMAGLLTDQEAWVPGLARAVGRHTSIGFDCIIMLPGFGCIIEGWVVSPVERVCDFSLRIGDSVRRGNMRATFRKPRPDLASAFPNHVGLLPEAGFVAFFPFPGEASLSGAAILKLEYDSAASTNHALPEQDVLWLQRGVGEEQLLRCYPNIEHETFFADLVSARRDGARAERPHPRPMAVHRAAKLLVRVVGPLLSDAYRAADELTAHGAWLAEQGWQVAILGQDEARHHLLMLTQELPELGLQPPSLYLQCGPGTLDDVASILETAGCDAFLLARSEARLTLPALRACIDAMAAGDDLAVAALAKDGLDGAPPLLGWRAAALQRFVREGRAWRDIPFHPVAHMPICGQPARTTAFGEKLRLAGLAS